MDRQHLHVELHCGGHGFSDKPPSGYDLERVIIDGTATAAQFLELLTTLPAEFLGDILLVTRDGRGFLSSAGRGDGRVLYSLDERDLEFYLRANALLWATAPQAAIA